MKEFGPLHHEQLLPNVLTISSNIQLLTTFKHHITKVSNCTTFNRSEWVHFFLDPSITKLLTGFWHLWLIKTKLVD